MFAYFKPTGSLKHLCWKGRCEDGDCNSVLEHAELEPQVLFALFE